MRAERGLPGRPKRLGAKYRWVMGAVGALAAAAVTPGSATAQEADTPRYEVRRTTAPIFIDGILDDDAWAAASTPATLQGLWENQTGLMQGTTVRLLWDDEYLYVAYDCEDIDITAVYENRDDPTYRDDAVEIFLNPLPDQIDVYVGLEMNARGVLYDYLMYDARHALKRFDLQGVRIATDLRGTLNQQGDEDGGWSLEVAIPWENFADFGPTPTAGTTWKANLNRWDGVAPDRRMSIWADPRNDRSSPHAPEYFGDLAFVD